MFLAVFCWFFAEGEGEAKELNTAAAKFSILCQQTISWRCKVEESLAKNSLNNLKLRQQHSANNDAKRRLVKDPFATIVIW